MNTKKTGRIGEEMALAYIKKNNIKILDTNFRSRFGEIDIIGLNKKNLIFYEVKYRKNNNYGDSSFTINQKKKKKLIKTAMYFIILNQMYKKHNIRFDAILINNFQGDVEISFIKNIIQTDNNINGFFY